jgi:hypothetical protein
VDPVFIAVLMPMGEIALGRRKALMFQNSGAWFYPVQIAMVSCVNIFMMAILWT